MIINETINKSIKGNKWEQCQSVFKHQLSGNPFLSINSSIGNPDLTQNGG